MMHRVIGIDLGTTYSAVAAYDIGEGRPVVLRDPESGRTSIPSVVALPPSAHRVKVGWESKLNLLADEENTLREAHRELGRLASGEPMRFQFPRLPGQWFLPQEALSFVLMKMKEVAEYHIGEEVRDAVITVPGCSRAVHRKAIEEAALLTGLYPLQLIPSPVAAAVCYGKERYDPDLHRPSAASRFYQAASEEHIYLVYDLGGGKLDVSIICVGLEEIRVLASAGDPILGGCDFDAAITEWAMGELQREHGLDVSESPQARAAIRYAAEEAKIRLSSFDRTELRLPGLGAAGALVLELTRTQLELLIEHDLARSRGALGLALECAAERGCRREDLRSILLVGGSSGIPAVRAMLKDYFGRGEDFLGDVFDLPSVAARGAAILAQRYRATDHPFDLLRRPDTTLIDPSAPGHLAVELITEYSLGVEVQDNRFVQLIDRGRALPASATVSLLTRPGSEEYVRAQLFQGESTLADKNMFVGELVVGPVRPLPEGTGIEATIALDLGGVPKVSARDRTTGAEYQAELEHGATAESDDALVAMRGRLLDLYLPSSVPEARRAEAVMASAPSPPTPPLPTSVEEHVHRLVEEWGSIKRAAEGGISDGAEATRLSRRLDRLSVELAGMKASLRDEGATQILGQLSDAVRHGQTQFREFGGSLLASRVDQPSRGDVEAFNALAEEFRSLLKSVEGGVSSRSQLQDLSGGMQGLEIRTAELLGTITDSQGEEALAQLRGGIAHVLGQLPGGTAKTEELRAGEKGVSATPGDVVDCTVFSPPETPTGESILVQVFTHLPDKAEQARKHAEEFDADALRLGVTSLPTEIHRGTMLTFELMIRELTVHDPVQELVWRGRTESVQFEVSVPSRFRPRTVIGTVLVSQASVPIGHVRFKLRVVKKKRKADTRPVPNGDPKRYRMAFISYASENREEVLKRVQMLPAVGIRYFQDVLDLDPGDRWARKLYERINASDVLFLFWSTAARDSEWVRKEWKYGLKKKGDDFIRPVIIEGPPFPEPPSELAHLHFGDKVLYFLNQ